MNRTAFWSLVAFATFTIGIIITFFLFGFDHSKVQEVKAPPSFSQPNKDFDLTEKSIITYYELANNPEKYDKKTVRVRARLVAGKHGLLLLNSNRLENTEQTAVSYYPQNKDEIEKKLGRGFDADFNIVAVGNFKRVIPTNQSDSAIDTSRLQFEITRIEQATKF